MVCADSLLLELKTHSQAGRITPELLATLRAVQAANQARRAAEGLPVLPWGVGEEEQPAPDPAGPALPTIPESVKVYPSIAAAALRQGQAAGLRFYCLATALDATGRGCVTVEELRAAFSDVVSWRRLRQILAAGDGIYWTRGKRGGLWLHSAARIAAKLKLERLAGLPVEIPIEKLTGGIGDVKAALYATFHASRPENNPISRGKLAQLIGVGETSQRTYERKMGIIARKNIALGEEYNRAAVQDAAWEHHNVFIFTDWHGKHGERQGQYVAWRLPNSYETDLLQLPKGRQAKINRVLASYNEGRGNDNGFSRTYYQDSKAAERARADHVIYHGGAPTIRPDINQQPTRLGAVAFWYPLEVSA